jgi:hypothetical protein
MVERCVKTVQEYLRKAALMNETDWEHRLPLFLLAY